LVGHRWYSRLMPTQHPRVQVTKDPELAEAIELAKPHLRPGMPLSQQIRELAIIGSRHLNGMPTDDDEIQRRMEKLVDMFQNPEAAGLDWELLRDVKQVAWRKF
jgi:hypothetical protein